MPPLKRPQAPAKPVAVIVVAALAVVVATSWFAIRHALAPRFVDCHGRPNPAANVSVFSPDALKAYDGTHGNPMYLVVLGEVFDVSSGSKYYASGHGYHIFVGQDSSRSFASGDWSNAVEDVRDLPPSSVAAIVGWRRFYRTHQQYRHVGRVSGVYYDCKGNPTPALREVESLAGYAHELELAEKRITSKFAWCDSEWKAEDNMVRISCLPAEDGSSRFPRQLSYLAPGTTEVKEWCACLAKSELADLPADLRAARWPQCAMEWSSSCEYPKT